MNRLLIFSAVLIGSGCTQPQGPTIDLGDMEDYMEFMEDKEGETELNPFKAEPLIINASGKVRVEPDIAVITATITAQDKNESQAFDNMSKKINAVQEALSNRKVETGFTTVNSSRKFDQACQNHNWDASRRHGVIQSDYYFNRRLDQQGDTETKRRAPKPRIAQKVCAAQSIKVATNMVIRIQPAEAAGEALRALAEAGAENSRLFGYDFTNFDTHYQKAAEKAVEQAREKAEAHARLTGTKLGEIEKFTVSPPERTGRFGPQPNVIHSARRYQGQRGSVVDRQVNRIEYAPQPAASFSCWDGSVVSGAHQCPSAPQTFMQNTCWDGSITMGACPPEPSPAPAYGAGLGDEIIVTATRRGRGSGSGSSGYVSGGYGGASNTYSSGQNTTNALSMSLLSGPQTITVNATLHYSYETPLDGKVIVKADAK